FKK
ncbi:histidinol dehydrogenase family protein, partial [Vibrio parahaemolyticus V-223/04]